MNRFKVYKWNVPTEPIRIQSGIRAQSKRGAFAQKWWGKRWLAVLDGFGIGARLQRGRTYARSGQVADLRIERGLVRASVQGSRSSPYAVEIRFRVFSVREWSRVLDVLLAQPLHAAKLLSNEMPEEIEAVFKDAGLSLFPVAGSDLETDCSCPDWSNPCKHVAAVYCLMGEAFDADPFLLLRLRGMDREQFLAELKQQFPEGVGDEEPATPVPLPMDGAAFWHGAPGGMKPAMGERPGIAAAIPKRLGPLGFWRTEIPFLDHMEALYKGVHGVEEP